MNYNSVFKESVILLRDLAKLQSLGLGETEEADKIREQGEKPYYLLTEEQQDLLDWLSIYLWSETKNISVKVYLDDVRPIPDGWMGVNNIRDVKQLLLSERVDYLSLDNDLGGACQNNCWISIADGYNQMVKQSCVKDCECGCHKDGYKLVLWMIEHDIWPKNKPTVHSHNSIRASYMRQMIDRYGPYDQN